MKTKNTILDDKIQMEVMTVWLPMYKTERDYSDIENLLLLYFLQKDYFKRYKTIFKRKSAI